MAACVPTTFGGREHGHIGMIMENAEYIAFSNGGVSFVMPTNPEEYLMTVSIDAVTQEHEIVGQKAKQDKWKTYLGVTKTLHLKLKGAVNEV